MSVSHGERSDPPQSVSAPVETEAPPVETPSLPSLSEPSSEPETQTEPTEPVNTTVDASWFDNAAFVGDSISLKLSYYAAALGRVEQCLNNRLDNVMAQAQNYDPESLAVAQQCKVLTQGSYAALFLSPQHEAMEAIFAESFQ